MNCRLVICFTLLTGLLLGSVKADDAQSWTNIKPDSIKKWVLAVEKLGASYRKGSTEAESKLRFTALLKDLEKDLDGSVIEFKIQIREVKWKDGIAEVYTLEELPLPKRPTAAMPLHITRLTPIELAMDQETATKIKPGEWLNFKGRLKFHPGRWGAVGKAEKAQQLYTLRHESLSTLFLGTYTTTEYECHVNREDVQERWAQ